MAWDSVPWFVGGGAQHSSEVARLFAYIATGGREGIIDPLDLRVLELSTPGSSIRVTSGACVIRSRALGGDRQSYMGYMPSEDVVGVNPTDASGSRSDLLIARVENPFISGEPWTAPVDPTTGPYIFTRIIENVPNTTKSVRELVPDPAYSAITLARIDIPPSTGTITQSMIKDMRSSANGSQNPGPGDGNEGSNESMSSTVVKIAVSSGSNDKSTSTWSDWPSAASWSVPIPTWATTCEVNVKVQNLQLRNNDVFGNCRVQIDATPGLTMPFALDYQSCVGKSRETINIAGSFSIGAAARGRIVPVKTQVQVNSGGGTLRADSYTVTRATLVFRNTPSMS